MFKLLQRFIREEDGQDFAEYALILGAVGVAVGMEGVPSCAETEEETIANLVSIENIPTDKNDLNIFRCCFMRHSLLLQS